MFLALLTLNMSTTPNPKVLMLLLSSSTERILKRGKNRVVVVI